MADNKNLTVFQRLGQVLSPDAPMKKQIQQTQKYNVGKGELLKTDNKAEDFAAWIKHAFSL